MSPARTVLEYRKTGGFAGIEQVLRIDEDGTARLERSVSGAREEDREARLPPERLRELRSLAEQSRLESLPGPPPGEAPPPFDGISRGLRFAGRNVDLGPADVPEDVRPLLDRLEAIVRELLEGL